MSSQLGKFPQFGTTKVEKVLAHDSPSRHMVRSVGVVFPVLTYERS